MKNPDNIEKLLLGFDGTGILRTMWGADRDEPSPQKAEKAINNSIGTFRRVLKQFDPTHVIAAFDAPSKNWRHDLWPSYKEGREPMHELLRARVPDLLEMLRSMHVTCLEVPGVEAEDVLATSALRWVKGAGGCPKGRVVVASKDKDLLLLVRHGVEVYEPFEREMRGSEYIESKFKVKPEQLGDCFALAGDTVDNVPGIPNVKYTVAGEWLKKYGSLDNLIAKSNEISGVRGENLRKYVDDALMSRILTSLKDDVPLGVTWNSVAYPPGIQSRCAKMIDEAESSQRRTYRP